MATRSLEATISSVHVSQTTQKREEQQQQTGYECIFAESLPSDIQYECAICLNVLRDPHMVGCCGYRFCRNCILPIQKQIGCCPLCNNTFGTLPDKQLQRVLMDKMVYCSFGGENSGCPWKGKLKDLDNHTKKCTWTEVLCPHCSKTFTQYSLTRFHIEDCSVRRLAAATSKISELTDENTRLKERLEKEPQGMHLGNITEYLSVTNLPPYVTEGMLKSVFGQFGTVVSVTLSYQSDMATIEYECVGFAGRALSHSKEKGVNLKLHRLCLSPVYKPASETYQCLC